MAVGNGTGTTITFDTGFMANLLSVTPFDVTREALDTSNMSTTGARTKIPGDLHDWQALSAEIQFDVDDQPPIDQAAEDVTVTFPDGGSVAGSAFMTGMSATVEMEGIMTASVTIMWAGAAIGGGDFGLRWLADS